MAFGKKKDKQKNTREEQVKAQMVEFKKNPLYPEKQENTLKEVMMALGTVVVCLGLVAVIFMNFSYAVTGYEDAYASEAYTEDNTLESGTEEEDVLEEHVETEEEIAEEETVDLTQGDYIITDSDSRYISTSELDGLTQEELSYARNEIYARHGRLFKDAGLQSYFDSKEWYVGTISPDSFSQSMLNDYEIQNAETILSYEKSKGYR